MKTLGNLAGTMGSDIYAAGTYTVINYNNTFHTTGASEDVLLRPIRAVEWAGTDFVISAVYDCDGRNISSYMNWVADGTTITSDIGSMAFPCDVYEFTTSASCKCWYTA